MKSKFITFTSNLRVFLKNLLVRNAGYMMIPDETTRSPKIHCTKAVQRSVVK